jgi:hypothetical protein
VSYGGKGEAWTQLANVIGRVVRSSVKAGKNDMVELEGIEEFLHGKNVHARYTQLMLKLHDLEARLKRQTGAGARSDYDATLHKHLFKIQTDARDFQEKSSAQKKELIKKRSRGVPLRSQACYVVATAVHKRRTAKSPSELPTNRQLDIETLDDRYFRLVAKSNCSLAEASARSDAGASLASKMSPGRAKAGEAHVRKARTAKTATTTWAAIDRIRRRRPECVILED